MKALKRWPVGTGSGALAMAARAALHGSSIATSSPAASAPPCSNARRDRPMAASGAGGMLDPLTDAHIGATAAEIAGHRRIDIGIVGSRIAGQQRGSRHDLSRLAITALDDLQIDPRFLDLRACGGVPDAFDRRDRTVADTADRELAGSDGDAVEMNGTR